MSRIIMGIQLSERTEDSPDFQRVISKYGNIIQTRLGLHEETTDNSGIIVLDFVDNADSKVRDLEEEISAIGKVNIQKMFF